MRVISCCGLVCISIMTNDIGCLFMCICTSSVENTSDPLDSGDTRIAQGPQRLPIVIQVIIQIPHQAHPNVSSTDSCVTLLPHSSCSPLLQLCQPPWSRLRALVLAVPSVWDILPHLPQGCFFQSLLDFYCCCNQLPQMNGLKTAFIVLQFWRSKA